MTSCRHRIREALEAVAPALSGVISVHVFGSALHYEEPRDLDLLVVYNPFLIPPRRAGALQAVVAGACAAAALPPADVVLLTEAEAEATQFARREHARLVYPHSFPS